MDANKDFTSFMKFVKQNQEVRNELQLHIKPGVSYDLVVSTFVDAGLKHGYSFTADDVEMLLDEALADMALKSGELTDEQLETIAGGGGKGPGAAGIIELALDAIVGLIADACD